MASKGKQLSLKGSRQNIKCEKPELLMILRCYQVHPGDYESIVGEIIENKDKLSCKVAEFYATTPTNKLKSRVRDQIFLMLSKKKNLTDEELSKELEAVCQMQETISTKVISKDKDKEQDIRQKWAISPANKHQSDHDSSVSEVECDEPKPSTSKGIGKKRKSHEEAPKKKSKISKQKRMEMENTKMYNQLLKVILPKAEKLFGSSSSSESTESD